MTDLREAVARALCEYDCANWDASTFNQTPSGEDPDDMREGYLEQADAALKAIEDSDTHQLIDKSTHWAAPLEATEEMIEAGHSRALEINRMGAPAHSSEVYTAMRDAHMKEDK